MERRRNRGVEKGEERRRKEEGEEKRRGWSGEKKYRMWRRENGEERWGRMVRVVEEEGENGKERNGEEERN